MSSKKKGGEWSSTPRAKRHRKPLTLTLSEAALSALKVAAKNGIVIDCGHIHAHPPFEHTRVFASQSAVVEWLIDTYL